MMDSAEVIDDRYQVLALLGSGGMADVYEVEHRLLGRRFALKLLRAELARDPAIKARFEREARAVARLSSEHIVAIVDCGVSTDGAPFFVMERLQGSELRLLLETDGTLPLQRALHLALDVCRALQVAHGAGVIHRDLKPENLFLVRDGDGRERCKVLDFGVAKLSHENPTLPGTLLGTARYMAPEQIGGDGGVAPTTDVFALGVILFECLSGTPPFSADTLERVLYKIVNDTPPSLLELRPDLPRALAKLVDRMLAKSPGERPRSARELAELLSTFTLEARAVTGGTGATDSTLFDASPPLLDSGVTPTKRAGISRLLPTFALGVALGLAIGLAMRGRPAAAHVDVVTRDTPPSATTPSSSAPPQTTTPAETAAVAPVSANANRLPTGASVSPSSIASRPSTRPSVAASAPAAPGKPPLFYPQETPP